MSGKPDDSDPAFPVVPQAVTNPFNPNERIFHHGHYGLSKREWFAGMALQGILCANVEIYGTQEHFPNVYEIRARESFRYADALIKANKS